MPLGTVAIINLMKAVAGQEGKYEKAESEVFKPMHQKDVDNWAKRKLGLVKSYDALGK